jgi:hypothetical protein
MAGYNTFWIGQDNNVWAREGNKVSNYGQYLGGNDQGFDAKNFSAASIPQIGLTWQRINDPNLSQQTGSYSGGGGSGSSAQQQASQLQIDQINRLLGLVDTQRNTGVQRIDEGYNTNKTRLTEDKTRAFNEYGQQELTNDKNKQKGFDQVDDFANTSYTNLQRLLQGANAGNSSVGRQLVPHLISKGAGKRRTGVVETAGENAQAIQQAKDDAETQFARSFADIDTQYKNQKSDFLSQLEQQRMDLLAQRLGIEADADRATAGTEAALNERAAQLQQIFGFKPSFNPTAVNLKTPKLSQYQVDPAQIRLDQNAPAETRFYNPLLKKREELRG